MGLPNRKENPKIEHYQNAIYWGDLASNIVLEKDTKSLKQWFVTSSEPKPISLLCNIECPLQIESCTAMTYKLVNGYHKVTGHDTPLESVISQDDFINSKKSRNTLLRYILQRKKSIASNGETYFSTHPRPIALKQIRATSSCLADKLTALEH